MFKLEHLPSCDDKLHFHLDDNEKGRDKIYMSRNRQKKVLRS